MKPGGQMTLTLTDELEQFVKSEVKRGAYASSSEYIRELVRERYVSARERSVKQAELDAALAKGLAQAEAGQLIPIENAFARLRAELGVDGKSDR